MTRSWFLKVKLSSMCQCRQCDALYRCGKAKAPRPKPRGSLNGSKRVNILTSRLDRGGSDELASSSAVDNANQKRFQHQGGGKRRRESRAADGACADGGLGQRQVDGRARIASRARLALSGR